jgi:hypothetical protein
MGSVRRDGRIAVYINGSDIDGPEILEYWRMSRAFKVSRYDRLQWTAERYSNLHFTVPSVRAYKAADILTRQV